MPNKFKVGDILTVADPADPSHFKRFQKVIGLLPVEEGMIPYSLKSFQTDRIMGPQELNPAMSEMRTADLLGLYTFRTIKINTDSIKDYFESMYRALNEQEKLIYIHE